VARTAAFGSGILAASTSWNHFSNCRKGSRARSFSDRPARGYSFLSSASVIEWHAAPGPFPCQKASAEPGGGSARERADDPGMRGKLAHKRIPAPKLEFPLVPGGQDRAAEKGRPAENGPAPRPRRAARENPPPLPFARGNDSLGRVASLHVRSQHAHAAGTRPRIEPDELRGGARAVLPYLVHPEPVERREVILGDQEEDGRAQGPPVSPFFRAC